MTAEQESIYSRQHLLNIIKAAGDMVGQKLPTPKCLECDRFSGGFCTQWQQPIPVEAWAAGCDQFDMFVPF